MMTDIFDLPDNLSRKGLEKMTEAKYNPDKFFEAERKMTHKNMPCVYWADGDKCSKFTDDECLSFCVLGPCSAMRPSNADRIRAMSDEELAEWLTLKNTVPGDCRLGSSKCGSCKRCWIDWLQQEVDDGGSD